MFCLKGWDWEKRQACAMGSKLLSAQDGRNGSASME